jgi:hypothetical protein
MKVQIVIIYVTVSQTVVRGGFGRKGLQKLSYTLNE